MKTIDILKFWQTTEMAEVIDHPEILSDGFAIDFNDHGIDKSKLTFTRKVAYPTKTIDALINPRSKLEYVREKRRRPFYVYELSSASGDTTMVQKQYCEYFYRVYPGCIFKARRVNGIDASMYWTFFPYIAVHHEGKLVGGMAAIR